LLPPILEALMFLSKSSRRYYYLFYLDQAGRRHKISTKCKLKSDALEFLRDFDRVAKERTARRRQVTLSKFKDEYLTYSKTNHSPKTTEIIATSFRELLRITGDILLVDVDTKDIERFITRKTAIASARTARTYLVTLTSAFETARRWVDIFLERERDRLATYGRWKENS